MSRLHALIVATIRGQRRALLPLALLIATAVSLAGAGGHLVDRAHALDSTTPSLDATTPQSITGPFWVDQPQYGSTGGGFYWDPNSEQVWTHERGWHLYSPQSTIIIIVVWVNAPFYGNPGGGFYWDCRSGLVWTPQLGWHRFNPYQNLYPPTSYPPNPNPYPSQQLQIWTDRGDGSVYHAGERIRICWTTGAPMDIQIVDFPADGSQQVLLSRHDNGNGGCFSGQVTPPYGRETVSIIANGQAGPYSINSVIPYPGPVPGQIRADTYFFVSP
jgi:hypothetical protein